jgi:hypothetical protein
LKTTEKGLVFLQKYIALEDLLDGPAKHKMKQHPSMKVARVQTS